MTRCHNDSHRYWALGRNQNRVDGGKNASCALCTVASAAVLCIMMHVSHLSMFWFYVSVFCMSYICCVTHITKGFMATYTTTDIPTLSTDSDDHACHFYIVQFLDLSPSVCTCRKRYLKTIKKLNKIKQAPTGNKNTCANVSKLLSM